MTADRAESAPEALASWDEGVSLLRVANVLLGNLRVLVGLPLAVAAVFVGVGLLNGPRYTTDASFVAVQHSDNQISGPLALAAEFGVLRPGASQSPAFYAGLLGSREILRNLAQREYGEDSPAADGEATTYLARRLGVRESSPPLRLEKTIDALEDVLRVDADNQTGVVTFSVTTREPALSQALAENLLAAVGEFDRDTRRSQASAEREFVEGQLALAEQNLLITEDSLQAFLQNNRRWENSPGLTFEHDRLQRRVDLRQQRYLELNQAYERARIEEVRNTPVVNVLEKPRAPVRADVGWMAIRLLLGLAAGLGAVLAWVCGRELLREERARDPALYEGVASAARGRFEGLRRIGRRSRS